MNAVVIDTSALIAVITNEPSKDNLIRLTQNTDLIAPRSIHWEIGNAFSAMLKRNRITVDNAIQGIKTYQQIPIRLVEVELEETIKLATDLNIYAYDAYLVRCALKYKSLLLTLDQGLRHAAKSAHVQILEVTT